MGAGASIPEELDLAAAKELAGDKFDEAKFNAVAVEGKISKAQFEEAVAAATAATAQLAASESAPAALAQEGEAEADEEEENHDPAQTHALRRLLVGFV